MIKRKERGNEIMIIYKRKITQEDIINLKIHEELIYYKTEDIAITVDKVDDNYVLRKRGISENELIDEIVLKTVNETMEHMENQM